MTFLHHYSFSVNRFIHCLFACCVLYRSLRAVPGVLPLTLRLPTSFPIQHNGRLPPAPRRGAYNARCYLYGALRHHVNAPGQSLLQPAFLRALALRGSRAALQNRRACFTASGGLRANMPVRATHATGCPRLTTRWYTLRCRCRLTLAFYRLASSATATFLLVLLRHAHGCAARRSPSALNASAWFMATGRTLSCLSIQHTSRGAAHLPLEPASLHTGETRALVSTPSCFCEPNL